MWRLPERAPDLLPDHDAAEGRGDDRIALKRAKLVG
jgi:hypothetical protein